MSRKMKAVFGLIVLLSVVVPLQRSALKVEAEVQSTPNYVYRVDPTGFVCGDTGPSPGYVALRGEPEDAQHEIEMQTKKCNDTNFMQPGDYEIWVDMDADGDFDASDYQIDDGTYASGEDVITDDVDPVEDSVYGPHDYMVKVYSDDQPTTAKHTGVIRVWEEYMIPTPPQHANIYQVNPSGYTCGSYIQAKFVPDDTAHDIKVYMSKCNGSDFLSGGKAYIYVDGVPRWGPFTWSAGGTEKYLGSIDPLDLDFSGTHNYKVVVYSDDLPTNPNKYSGVISAWDSTPATPTYNTAFLTDEQLENYSAMTADQIRQFLTDQGSYFRQTIQDVDGVTFDPAEVIAQAAQDYRINPQVILTTLQKESSGVTRATRPSDATMRALTGCSSGDTAREQLACTAERFRRYHDMLTGAGVSPSGWQVGVPKDTQDGVTVTPATKAVAGQFTYTPYAGEDWGGAAGVGGVSLFYALWTQFGFDSGAVTPPDAPGDFIVNYQAPCRPGSQAGLTTWHDDGSLDRYAYDWICTEGPAVYAPHGGTVAYSGDEGGDTDGMIMINESENSACLILIHLDPSRLLVSVGATVSAGQQIGYYTTSAGHTHVAAVPGPCSVYNHSDEQPIRFNELGYVPSQRITELGTHPQSEGARIYVTAGANVCASPYSTLCVPPSDSPQSSSTGHFPDVTYDYEFYPYIETLYWLGAVRGYSDGLYRPEEAATRGQAAKIIVLSLGEYREYTDGRQTFPDVPPSYPFYHYIERLVELGITSGYSDGTFRPDDALQRGQAAKLIVKARGESPNYTDGRQTFPDVPPTHDFYHYIERLAELGVISGYSDGTFRPNDAIGRGQLAKMTVLGLPGLADYIPTFYDVLRDHPFSLYVESIADRGITDGCSKTPPLFCPDDDLLRGQAAKFIIRGLGEEPYYTDGRQTFPDVPTTHTFYHYIERLAELGITDGFSDGTFRPDQPITRGEIAKLIIRALGEGDPHYTDGRQTFPDVPSTQTFYHYIERLYELGITSGYSDGTYRPGENIDRGQTAKFIHLAFIDRAPALPQEASDGLNGNLATAPTYVERALFVTPGGDLDYIKLPTGGAVTMTHATQSASAPTAYRLTLDSSGPNADMQLQVVDASGNLLASASQDQTSDGGASIAADVSLLWTVPAPGEYYVLLVNTNSFAQEGAYTYFSTGEVSVVYLPIILR